MPPCARGGKEQVMKALKKVTSVLISLLLIFTFALPAFADEAAAATGTITAPNNGHTYEVYQIFTGDLHEGKLSNIKWGANSTGTAGESVPDDVLTALQAVKGKATADILAEVEKYAKLDTPTATIASGASCTVPVGYYLIKDKDNTVPAGDAHTTYIVTAVGDVTIEPKVEVPSFEKKIKDTNDTTGVVSDWQDSADYDIGDKVPFKLEGTVAANYADYKTYYFAFHDVEEKGLSFNKDSVKVYVGDSTEPLTSGYEVVTAPTDGCSFEVIFQNLKEITSVTAGTKIRVEYTSTLTTDAKLGSEGNVNKAKLEFSNNPNEAQGGSGKPSTGETPWDNVIVFTYKVVVTKKADAVNGENLPGAEFTLTKKLADGTTKKIAVVKSEDGTQFSFTGLDDGEYTLTETKTPKGYNTIQPITFTVNADHTITWDGTNREAVLTSLTGTAASGEITFTANESKDELATAVVNKSGTLLPGTGGIGTTIFYIVGGLMMAVAAVLLITKKRMNSDK